MPFLFDLHIHLVDHGSQFFIFSVSLVKGSFVLANGSLVAAALVFVVVLQGLNFHFLLLNKTSQLLEFRAINATLLVVISKCLILLLQFHNHILQLHILVVKVALILLVFLNLILILIDLHLEFLLVVDALVFL